MLALSASAPAATRPEEIKALAEQLEADAALWLAEKPVAKDTRKKLDAVSYDTASLGALKAALARPRKPRVRMYVTARLLEPLNRAPADVAAEALPIVRNARETLGKFKKLRKYSKAALKKYRMPPPPRRGVSPGRHMKQVARIQANRDKKRLRELPHKQHNQLAYRILLTYYRVLLRTGEAADDDVVLGDLAKALRRTDWLFVRLTTMLADGKKTMSRPRALRCYEQLASLARKHRYDRQTYMDRGEVVIVPAGGSVYRPYSEMAGARLAKAANALRSKAGRPKIPVPTHQDITKHIQIQSKRRK